MVIGNDFKVAKCPECGEELFRYKIDESSRFVIKIKCQKCEKRIIVKAMGGVFK